MGFNFSFTRRQFIKRAMAIASGLGLAPLERVLSSTSFNALASGPVQITQVAFSPTTLRVSELLNITITVKNNSTETFQTQGPPPGFVYEQGEWFRGEGFPEVAGALRVGVDFDGRDGWDHPYRWGLGAPLAPGQTSTVTGAIRLKSPQAVNYWAGLVREWTAWMDDRQGTQRITTIGYTGSVQITNVQFVPTTVRAGEVLLVIITVQNQTNDTLGTQGPDPGFVYEEGENYRSRGFGEVSGAYRVGIDFQGRSGPDHPYRWGLGAPLAPGQSAIVTGAIRMKTPRQALYWAGLVREWISWVQDSAGAQTITVAPSQPTGSPRILSVAFTPTSLKVGDQLNVAITVRNDSSETLTTQGPNPGFVYDEGDSYQSRGYSEVSGAFRVGIDFDGRAGPTYPYRWGLGAALAPGQTTVVNGAIQMKNAQNRNYWAGSVRELVGWVQEREGTQAINVSSTPPPNRNARVVHVHSDNATWWNGQREYWNFINQNVVNDMIERGIVALTGIGHVPDAWRAILPNYQPGQGIAIKINATNGGNYKLDSVPQAVNAIVRGLKQIGVRDSDVWVYDASSRLVDRYVRGIEYGAQFFDDSLRQRATFDSTDPTARIAFSAPSGIPAVPAIRVTDVLVNARYVINVPILKAHFDGGAGLTLGFKNHLGSVHNPEAFHNYIFPEGPYFRSDYNPLVDLNRNANIGPKTVLTIGEALFAGTKWDSDPLPMRTFDYKLPHSFFFSTDPVAIDSVMCDFIIAEWGIPSGADNYLRLANAAGMGVYERGDPWGAGYKVIDYQRVEV